MTITQSFWTNQKEFWTKEQDTDWTKLYFESNWAEELNFLKPDSEDSLDDPDDVLTLDVSLIYISVVFTVSIPWC